MDTIDSMQRKPRRTVAVYLTVEQAEAAIRRADREGTSVSEIVRRLLQYYVVEEERREFSGIPPRRRRQ